MILTSNILKEYGFNVKVNTICFIDYEFNNIIISSDESINSGGFNYNGIGLNTEKDLVDILLKH
jgi:hypothetical protein